MISDLERRLWLAEIRSQHLEQGAEKVRQLNTWNLQWLAQLGTIEQTTSAPSCTITIQATVTGCGVDVDGATVTIVNTATPTTVYGTTTTNSSGQWSLTITLPSSGTGFTIQVVATGYTNASNNYSGVTCGMTYTTGYDTNLSVGTGYICSPCGALAQSWAPTLTSATFGATATLTNGGSNVWTGSLIYNYTSTCCGCSALSGLHMSITLTVLSNAWSLAITYSEFAATGCPGPTGSPGTISISTTSITLNSFTCNPTSLSFNVPALACGHNIPWCSTGDTITIS